MTRARFVAGLLWSVTALSVTAAPLRAAGLEDTLNARWRGAWTIASPL